MRRHLLLAVAAMGTTAGIVGLWHARRPEPFRTHPDPVRAAELRRAPRRPTPEKVLPPEVRIHDSWDEVYAGVVKPSPISMAAKPHPPTSCSAVRRIPKDESEDRRKSPHGVHEGMADGFATASGFGNWRMSSLVHAEGVKDETYRGYGIDHLELVSLLLHDDACAYVLDYIPIPSLTRAAARRPLDEFERLALDELRAGAELVGTPADGRRMFGALRAEAHCLDCHPGAKEGELLGAFSYWLSTPLEQRDR